MEKIYFRSDSAAYQHKLLDRLREGIELHGQKVAVEFAISADMTEALRGRIISVSEAGWKALRKISDKRLIEGRKEWAGGGVYTSGGIGEKGHEAGSLFSDSGKARSRGSVFGWQRLSLLCGGD